MTYFGEEEDKNRPYDGIDDVTEKRISFTLKEGGLNGAFTRYCTF